MTQLREQARVALVSPGTGSREKIGRNALDPGRRSHAAHAGRRQARAVAAEVRDVWDV